MALGVVVVVVVVVLSPSLAVSPLALLCSPFLSAGSTVINPI